MYLTLQIVGLLYLKGINLGPPNITIPLIASLVSYINSIFMGYAITSNCKKPKRSNIFYISLIVPVSVIMMFILSSKIFAMKSGFYDIFNSGKFSKIGKYVAISFWMSMIIFPAVSYTYFKLVQKACKQNSPIILSRENKNEN